jgi:DMSO/TMAO reductase YedYZ molybdopterin-dependent catalytic subunit
MTARAGRAGAAWGALCGVLAAAVAMGIAQLFAGLSIPAASPVIAVGQAAINLTPLPVKDWATSTFGNNDKNALLTGVFVVVFLYAIVVGVVAMRRLSAGFIGLAIFAAIGIAAALTRPNAAAGWALPTVGGALAGAFALYRLVQVARRLSLGDAAGASGAAGTSWTSGGLPPIVFGGPGGGSAGPGDPAGGAAGELRAPDLPDVPGGAGLPGEVAAPEPPGASVPALRAPVRPAGAPARRAFLLTAGVSVAAAAIGEFGGRELATRRNVSAARSAVRFPRAADPAAPLPAGVNLPVPGISPFITPNSQFYRVDTALIVPEVDPSNWQLRVHGMVAREISVTYGELLRRPLVENYMTLCCVSNPVGGPYIGNAKWLGASLASLLREAGPRAGASQLLCTSADGFTSGTPLSVVLDGRDALVAVAMNGAALPVEHGFPARLVVPGLYGYVSACKWVVDIEVTTFQQAVAYWAQRGWSQQGPIKTESRIDVPASGSQVKAGRVAVAGVAWAQHKGIDAVEVRVDGGQWHEATLAAVPNIDTWRQWVWQWEDAGVGPHMIEARATDKTGYTQTGLQADVAPNGATGYPSSQITVYQPR